MGLGFGLWIHNHSLVESTVRCSNNGVEVNENGSIVKGSQSQSKDGVHFQVTLFAAKPDHLAPLGSGKRASRGPSVALSCAADSQTIKERRGR